MNSDTHFPILAEAEVGIFKVVGQSRGGWITVEDQEKGGKTFLWSNQRDCHERWRKGHTAVMITIDEKGNAYFYTKAYINMMPEWYDGSYLDNPESRKEALYHAKWFSDSLVKIKEFKEKKKEEVKKEIEIPKNKTFWQRLWN